MIYDFNDAIDEGRSVVCPPDTELLDINLRMKSVLPQGYVFASGDAFNSPSSLFLNLAMVKPPPFLIDFVPDPVRVFVTYRCALTFVGGG